jgi:hypothetical protein
MTVIMTVLLRGSGRPWPPGLFLFDTVSCGAAAAEKPGAVATKDVSGMNVYFVPL